MRGECSYCLYLQIGLSQLKVDHLLPHFVEFKSLQVSPQQRAVPMVNISNINRIQPYSPSIDIWMEKSSDIQMIEIYSKYVHTCTHAGWSPEKK